MEAGGASVLVWKIGFGPRDCQGNLGGRVPEIEREAEREAEKEAGIGRGAVGTVAAAIALEFGPGPGLAGCS